MGSTSHRIELARESGRSRRACVRIEGVANEQKTGI
ncbi:hypothetical protein LINPERPRIM_LOCUS8447 [Linum perenne]